jgi:hypothetical protein
MATVEGTIDRPVGDTIAQTRTEAASHGYSLAEGQSQPDALIFTKGVSMFSWGSKLNVTFAENSPTQTKVTITTSETFALTDWGRGKRAAAKLLEAIGARHLTT